ncbi:Panacea domain-containing protein [Deinococcus fonticola]|uniref:Panacea domain-containing protein n=1 Tax=Deinococcus fonticola TaxID=2528713 RepID=UPI00107556AE|nr:type II toxin-antitoxin system antitoxin SocA domain-containing protein [Deinococcus fonticola]
MPISSPAEKRANHFIELAAADGRLLTHMQLQKLVYLAHSLALALHDRRLVANNFYAWRHGPVAPHLYEQLKGTGAQPVHHLLPEAMPAFDLDPQAQEVVKQTYEAYGRFDGWELRNITHLPGSPWSLTSEREAYGLIPDDLTRSY